MKNCLEISEKLLQDIMKEPFEKKNPRLDLVIQENDQGDSYKIHYAAKSLTVNAESPLAAVFAVGQQAITIPGGYWGEFVGSHSPRFPLRLMWLEADLTWVLSDRLSLSIPSVVIEGVEAWKELASHVLELGFNAVVVGAKIIPVKECTGAPVDDFCEFMRGCGVKVVVKPHYDQTGSEENILLNELFDVVGGFDYLFWERGEVTVPLSQRQKYTETELIVQEIHFLERYLPKKTFLIYYLPTNQAERMNKLLDEMHKGSLLAFSVNDGDFVWDHLPPHPFWDVLSQSPDSSGTGLLPIMNSGAVNQGEGMWPYLTTDLTEFYLRKCRRHHFAGVVCFTKTLPEKGEISECNFWVTGQLLWEDLPADDLVRMWLKCRYPEVSLELWKVLCEISRGLVLELSLLRYLANQRRGKNEVLEDGRLLIETITNYFNRLQHLKPQLSGSPLESLNRLCEDTRRQVKQIGQTCGLSGHIRI